MLAGRPHEAAGNGSPRWMIAAPREREHRTRPTGRLTPFGERRAGERMTKSWQVVSAGSPAAVIAGFQISRLS